MAVATSLNHYYMHGLSCEKFKALHGVVTHAVANFCDDGTAATAETRPTPPLQRLMIDGKRVGLIVYEYLGSMSRRKGSHPTVKDLKGLNLVDIDVVNDVDVLIVAGACGGGEMLLLAMIMRNTNPLNYYGGTLFSNLIRALPRSGREVKRTGGSSGICRKDDDFYAFLHTHGCFPRVSGGVIFLPITPTDRHYATTWRCLYMSPYQPYCSSLVTVDYTPPVQGGKFKISQHLLKAFPKFIDFFRVKRYLVHLLDKVNAKMNLPIITSKISIFKNKMKEKTDMEAVESCCMHTLVSHRVGYHFDVFDKFSSGIENKVLCVAEGKGGKKDGSSPSLGRGGGGPGVFTYAILDWP